MREFTFMVIGMIIGSMLVASVKSAQDIELENAMLKRALGEKFS